MTLFYAFEYFFNSIHLKETDKYIEHGLTSDDVEEFYIFLF